MDIQERTSFVTLLKSPWFISVVVAGLVFASLAFIMNQLLVVDVPPSEVSENEDDETGIDDEESEERDEEDEVEEAEGDAPPHDDHIEVHDQEAGSSVYVSALSLSDPRWVVIHEDQAGEPGNILGARLFSVDQEDGEVSLLRSTESGNTYHAILYMVADRDRDQGRRFDTDRDLPLIEEDGYQVITTFTAE